MSVTYTVLSPPSKSFPGIHSTNQYLVHGDAYQQAYPAQGQISYVGNNVLERSFATDGKTVVESVLGTDYQVIVLNGLIADTPSELLDNSFLGGIIGPLSRMSWNNKAGWKCGAEYIKTIRKTFGDTSLVGGKVIKDGTPFDNWIGAKPPGNFSIYLNEAAVESIKSAIKH